MLSATPVGNGMKNQNCMNEMVYIFAMLCIIFAAIVYLEYVGIHPKATHSFVLGTIWHHLTDCQGGWTFPVLSATPVGNGMKNHNCMNEMVYIFAMLCAIFAAIV